MSSRASSRASSQNTNIDRRIATGEGGIVLAADGENSTIVFEDINQDVVIEAIQFARDVGETFLQSSEQIFDRAITNTNSALANTQALAESLVQENNSPGIANIRNIIIAAFGGLTIAAVAFFWRNR